HIRERQLRGPASRTARGSPHGRGAHADPPLPRTGRQEGHRRGDFFRVEPAQERGQQAHLLRPGRGGGHLPRGGFQLGEEHGGPAGGYPGPSRSSSRSMSSAWAGLILRRAISTGKNSPRSTSGNSRLPPERGGHSIEKVLLRRTAPAGQSPSKAQASTVFPPVWRTEPSGISEPVRAQLSTAWPVSSSNSRLAPSSGSCPGPISPLGMLHAPSSLRSKTGPPGCTRNTSIPGPARRNIIRPELRFSTPWPRSRARDEQDLPARGAGLQRPVRPGRPRQRQLRGDAQPEPPLAPPVHHLLGPLEQLLPGRDVIVELGPCEEERAAPVQRLRVERRHRPARLAEQDH